jgi:hypothetical protein
LTRSDLGIMQVNSANLRRTDLQIGDAFDPEKSFRAGGAILLDAYLQCHGDAAKTHPQVGEALRCASSVYNTGNEHSGLSNGYTAGIIKAATQIVPSVRDLIANFSGAASGNPTMARPTDTTVTEVTQATKCDAPAWDVWRQQECRDNQQQDTNQ